MNTLQRSSYVLAQACTGNPISTTIVVALFFVGFTLIEASIENLIFGARFQHFLDPIFGLAFIGYAAYAVYWCAVFNSSQRPADSGKGGA